MARRRAQSPGHRLGSGRCGRDLGRQASGARRQNGDPLMGGGGARLHPVAAAVDAGARRHAEGARQCTADSPSRPSPRMRETKRCPSSPTAPPGSARDPCCSRPPCPASIMAATRSFAPPSPTKRRLMRRSPAMPGRRRARCLVTRPLPRMPTRQVFRRAIMAGIIWAAACIASPWSAPRSVPRPSA